MNEKSGAKEEEREVTKKPARANLVGGEKARSG